MAHSWHRAVGGERYAATMQHVAERKGLLDEAQQGIRQLLLAADPSSTRPVLSREEGVTRFAEAMEAVLRHGLLAPRKLSSSSSSWGEEDEVSVWAAMEEVLQRQWALEMRALVQVRTDNGRTRALLRAALNGKYLDHLLRALLPTAPRWYAEYALLRQTEEAEMLVGMLGGLAGVDFALPIDNPQLDAPRSASASAALKKSGHDLPTHKKKKAARRRVVAIDVDDGLHPPARPSADSSAGVSFTELAPSEVMALIDGPPADYEDEAAADKDAGGTPERVEDTAVKTGAATISSSSAPAPATVDDEAPMDNGMQRARSSSVEDWEKHELEMEALLASLQTDIIDIDTGDGDGGSRVERTPLPPPTASADKAPPDVIAAPAPHTERHEPPVEPGEAMANQRSHDHTDELEHTNEWVRSASDGDGDGGGVGAMSAKEREIEELQRKLRELEERLTAGSSDSPAGSLLLPSLLPPSFTSTPAHRPASSLRPLSASHSPSSLPSLSTPALPSAPSPSFAAASQHNHHQASPGSSPPVPPSSAASPSRAHPPPRRAGAGSGDTRLAAEVIDGLLADNPAADLDLLVPGEQQPQPPTRVPASGGGGGAVSLPPDRRDLFAASLFLSPVALPSASASSASSSSAQRRGRTGSALSPSSLSTASSSSFVPSSALSSSVSSLTSTSTSSLASSASAAAQRARRSPDAGAEHQQTAAALSGVGAGQRRQVLFHLHKRGSAADQNYLCAGCSAQFGSWLLGGAGRYCEYTGRYYCYECHVNEAAVIPARVLHEWDFRPYRVCRAARTIIDELYYLPAFAILDINPRLYAIAPALYDVRALREQLSYMKEFVVTCREKDRLIPLTAGRLDLINADEVYSLHDLVEAQSGRLAAFLGEVASGWLQHIARCELCRGKGSFCEVCNSDRPIYPFQLRTTTKCARCHALFHQACFDPQRCPKCARLTARKLTLHSSRSLNSSPASSSPVVGHRPPSSSSSSTSASSWSSFPTSSSPSAWSSPSWSSSSSSARGPPKYT